ncbi:MAG TPA: hypothetical protein VFS20_10420 [Longimicrobium sp.]|nr:hypothetical protein [Longimicrobium sp.]
MLRELESVLGNSEEVTPRRFLSLLNERGSDIERVSIKPPRLGRAGFGRIAVMYRNGARRLAPFGAPR